MKNLFLVLFAFGLSFNGLAQDPDIAGLWFLEKLSLNNTTYPAPMPTTETDEVLPQANFDQFVDGDGFLHARIDNCNDFLTALTTLNSDEQEFTVNSVAYLLGKCEPSFPIYIDRYYSFIDNENNNPETFSYEIIEETEEIKTLIITDEIGDFAKYSSIQMPFFLYDDWQLSSLTIEDQVFEVPNNSEEIVSSITFNETNNPAVASYSGDTGCNIFQGTNVFDVENNQVIFNEFDVIIDACNEQENNVFADRYINFLNSNLAGGFSYTVSQIPDLNTLELIKPNGDIATYNITTLSAPNFATIDFVIHPNPTSDILYITSENKLLKHVSIYNINGQRVMEQNNTLNSIDVSALQNGVYFMEINSENIKAIKKIIKH